MRALIESAVFTYVVVLVTLLMAPTLQQWHPATSLAWVAWFAASVAVAVLGCSAVVRRWVAEGR
jgi:positive regulator of sigma E activity